MARGAEHGTGPGAKDAINAANREALQREIAAARTLAAGRGLLAVNVMRAVEDYAELVRTSLQAGIDAVVVGAGQPMRRHAHAHAALHHRQQTPPADDERRQAAALPQRLQRGVEMVEHGGWTQRFAEDPAR